jgi:signal transduction histidine kinase
MNLLSGRIKKIGVISIILIVVISYGLFFYLQTITESNIRASLFEQQKMQQIGSTKDISQHIGSDLSLVMNMLDGLANSIYLQQGDLSSYETKKLIEEKYIQFNTTVNRLFVLNKEDVVTISLAPKRSDIFVGADYSVRDWVKETRSTLRPVFSDGFERQGVYRIFITYPIINRTSAEYLGLLGTSIPALEFFDHYGNVDNINSQFLVAFNKNATLVAVGASKGLIGENFFGEVAQKFVNYNEILNNSTRKLLAGNSDNAVYDYGQGERLTTANPIFINGEPKYFLQIVTPTSQIYSHINDVLFTEREKMFSLLAGTTAAIAILIIFLIKWNSTLGNEVKRRTGELNVSTQKLHSKTAELKRTNESLIESNKKLESANKLLELHDKMQKDFINVAAHELRTPIQPILGLAQVLRSRRDNENNNDKEMAEEVYLLDVMIRNAKRLQRLAEDILDVTKIEGNSLILHKEKFNLIDLMYEVIQDFKNQINNGKVKLIHEFDKDFIFVEGDRSRISQVVYNLLSNSLKFTKEGTISIVIEKKDSHAIISIKDPGTGIDYEILPRLFSKFASKSFEGTGLGLFISKSIIEAHGGKMWAENNVDGNGATFSFSLPLIEEEQQQLKNIKQMNQ